MLINEFDFYLPPDLIAQEPAEKRDAARLMTLGRRCGTIGEACFAELTGLFRDGDLLVINDTRVIPARLIGVKESGGRLSCFSSRSSGGRVKYGNA